MRAVYKEYEDSYINGYADALEDMRRWQQARRQQAEPLVIETQEPATEGSIRVYDYDGCCIYAYYGEIKINNDGRDGKQIDIECAGYLEGYQQHGTPESGGVHDE